MTGDLLTEVEEYLNWADAACCSLPRDILQALYNRYDRMRRRHFAQGVILKPTQEQEAESLACGNGICLTCNVETRTGQQLLCRDGPVFAVREIVL